LTEATDAYGTITYGYDASGNRTSRVVDDGSVTTETLRIESTSNRVLTVTEGANVRSLAYDAAGNIVGDDGSGTAHSRKHPESYAYHALERLVETTGRLSGVTSFEHDECRAGPENGYPLRISPSTLRSAARSSSSSRPSLRNTRPRSMVAATGLSTEGRNSPASFHWAMAASPSAAWGRAWLVTARMIRSGRSWW